MSVRALAIYKNARHTFNGFLYKILYLYETFIHTFVHTGTIYYTVTHRCIESIKKHSLACRNENCISTSPGEERKIAANISPHWWISPRRSLIQPVYVTEWNTDAYLALNIPRPDRFVSFLSLFKNTCQKPTFGTSEFRQQKQRLFTFIYVYLCGGMIKTDTENVSACLQRSTDSLKRRKARHKNKTWNRFRTKREKNKKTKKTVRRSKAECGVLLSGTELLAREQRRTATSVAAWRRAAGPSDIGINQRLMAFLPPNHH